MDVPVRLEWLPGEAIVVPGQFPVAPAGRSNELVIGPIQLATGSSSSVAAAGVSVRCTARTAEVLTAERGGGTATYECTLRGVAAEASDESLFILEYAPKGGLRDGSTITFKLLSLVDKSTIGIDSVELLKEKNTIQGAANEEPTTRANDNFQTTTASTSSLSQMEGIRDLLAQLAVETSSEDRVFDSAADSRRALMTAIAKSALKTSKQNMNNSNSGGGGGGFGFGGGNINLKSSNDDINAALSLLPQMFTLLQSQQKEIQQLQNSVNKLEALCRETHTMMAAHFSVEKQDTLPTL